MDAFRAPKEVERPEVVLAPEDQSWLDYVHATIAPKLVTAFALVGTCLMVVLPGLVLMLLGDWPDLLDVTKFVLYGIVGFSGSAAAAASVQALRAHEERLDLVVEALDTEVLFWQIAVLSIVLFYGFIACVFTFIALLSEAS